MDSRSLHALLMAIPVVHRIAKPAEPTDAAEAEYLRNEYSPWTDTGWEAADDPLFEEMR